MDGRGRCLDSVFVDRLWRAVKKALVHDADFRTRAEVRAAFVE